MFKIFHATKADEKHPHGTQGEVEVDRIGDAMRIITRLKNSRLAVTIQVEHPEGTIRWNRADQPGSPWELAGREDYVHPNEVLATEFNEA